MVRRCAIAATAALLASGGAPLAGQEIFWDGFEVGDLCAWSNPPVTVYQELEAFDEHTNDFDTDAEPIDRCAVVVGAIGEPELGATPDSDWYEIVVTGPVLLRVTIERYSATPECQASDFEPEGDFRNKSAFENFGLTSVGVPNEDPATTSRQIYLPENGFDYLDPAGGVGTKDIPINNNKWFVIVDDERNYPLDFDEPADPPVGGLGLCYRMILTLDPVVGQYTAPLDSAPVQMPADGSALSYRLEGFKNLDGAETFAARSGTFVDTKLYLVRKSGNTLVTLAGSDDFNEALHVDSKLESVALTADPHFVLVDPYSNGEVEPIDFPLTIQFVQALWH